MTILAGYLIYHLRHIPIMRVYAGDNASFIRLSSSYISFILHHLARYKCVHISPLIPTFFTPVGLHRSHNPVYPIRSFTVLDRLLCFTSWAYQLCIRHFATSIPLSARYISYINAISLSRLSGIRFRLSRGIRL